jgi:AraC-like DNA-binding protein
VVDLDIPRPPTSIITLMRLAAERGVRPESLFTGTKLSTRAVKKPGAEVTARQELRVVANLLDELGDPEALGIELGNHYHLPVYGIFGFALASSPNLRSAIDVGLRYVDLSFAIHKIGQREEGDQFHFVLDPTGIPRRLQRFVIERSASAIRTIHRELAGQGVPDMPTRFVFPPPQDVTPYVEAFGVEPEFDAADNTVALPLHLLDEPLPQGNEYTAAATAQQCRQLLEERRRRTGLSGQVRDLMLPNPADPPNADQIAALLAMSPRTLRHRLAAEGTSYRELLDEIRQRLAEEMLLTARLTVAETAQRLGYLELSSFSQAFRRWYGMSPRAYRTTHIGA